MKSLLAAATLFLLSGSVFAQSAPSGKITLTITRAELQVIGNGLAELPYKTAAQVMNDLVTQVNAADQAAAKAAAEAAKPAAEAPAEPKAAVKSAHRAKTIWPEMEQSNVDALTAAIKNEPGEVTIFCVEDAKCGDLALNLDNAFETAHWKSKIVDYAMVQPGIASSSHALVDALKSVGLDVRFDADIRPQSGESIAIGARP